MADSSAPSQRVIVTGGSGRTGKLVVLELLLLEPKVGVSALVRSQASENILKACIRQYAPQHLERLNIVHGNVDDQQALEKAFTGHDVVMLLTSAVPVLNKLSIPVMLFKRALRIDRSAKPTFTFSPGQEPKQVDYIGAVHQIDAAVSAGVKRFIFCGSIGGKDSAHDTVAFLNSMGGGNMLRWKRLAEQYLLKSGLEYTVVHPGGLLPHFGESTPAQAGQRPLTASVDDEALAWTAEKRMVPRSDLARVLVDCAFSPAARNVAFDLTAGPVASGPVYDRNLEALLAPLGGKSCTYEAVPAIDVATPPSAPLWKAPVAPSAAGAPDAVQAVVAEASEAVVAEAVEAAPAAAEGAATN